MAARVKWGWAASNWAIVSLAASRSRIDSTVMRVPAMTGLPIKIAEFDWING